MGSGKSTIGRLLAKELRLPFKDSDKVIEERTGADIPWIFDVEGEQGFRERERAAIAELCAENGLVMATGGGAVLREDNRQALKHGGRVIYLHASIEQQIERTSRDRNRPLLQTAIPRRCCAISWPCATRCTARSPISSSRPTSGHPGWSCCRYSTV